LKKELNLIELGKEKEGYRDGVLKTAFRIENGVIRENVPVQMQGYQIPEISPLDFKNSWEKINQ